MASYKAMRVDGGRSSAIDLNVNVLSASAWPTYPDVPVNVPPEIAQAVEDYDRHYRSKHTGRRLEWKHSLAHCVVRAYFPKGIRELVVSSFQAIVLLLFNGIEDGASLSYEQIRSTTGLGKAFPHGDTQSNTINSGRGAATNTAVAGVCQVPSAEQDAQGQGHWRR